jgi:uncharacterized protein YwgA
MTKIPKTIIIILSIFLLIGAGLGAYWYIEPILNTKYAEKAIIDEFNNGTKLSGSGAQRVVGGFSVFDKYRYTVILSQFDFEKPAYCFINSPKDNSNLVFIQSVNMKKLGYNTFEVINYSSASGSLSFIEAESICKKGDISKQTFENNNIRYTPPLTPSQIEEAERNAENEKRNIEVQQQQNNTANPQQKYELCIEDIKGYEELIQAALEGKTTYTGKYGTVPATKEDIPKYKSEQQTKIELCNTLKP